MEQQKPESAQTAVGSRSADKIKRKVTVGSVWESNKHGKFEVIEYINSKNVTIRFVDTGFELKTRSAHIRSGIVKDRLNKSVVGVGFIGIGMFNSKSRALNAWENMLKRCYNEKFHKKQPTYKDCEVCEDWHNFQNFAEWYEDNYPQDGADYQLDKDLKCPGNNEYSPKTCVFVPKLVNCFVSDSGASRGRYMIGAFFCTQKSKFASKCCNPLNNKVEHLGFFTSDFDAHLAWRKRKSELAYELAMIQDRDEVKEALLNWKRALDNFEIHKIPDGVLK